MGRWERREDAKNLTLIMASGAVGALITGGVLIAQSLSAHRARSVVWQLDAQPSVRVYHFVAEAPLGGSDRIYGTVRTVDGRELTGFIRWDRNEGSWTDVLDAVKVSPNGSESASGVRFGQIRAIRVQGPDRALVTLRSGERVEMTGGSGTDLGEGVRAIVVSDPSHGQSELDWGDVDAIELLRPPPAARPARARLYGTLATRSGQTYTGRIGWDMDEIYTTDVLDGDFHGSRQKIPFGAIARIDRDGFSAAHVVLRTGEEVTLRDTKDVNGENAGITVSDPTLGQVKVDWHDFDHVTFANAPQGADAVSFDGGRPLRGTVITEDGESLTGTVRWDDDEASTWEMLNGSTPDGAELEVEFGRIEGIRKDGPGVTVTLKDGRSLTLSGSNDVNAENRGIYVDTGNRVRRVAWHDFKELRLDD